MIPRYWKELCRDEHLRSVFKLSKRRIEERDEEICEAMVSLSWWREQDIGGLRREKAHKEVMKNKGGTDLHRVLEEYNLVGENPHGFV